MRLTEYHQLIVDEFGESEGKWISHSHVLAKYGETADELIERGVDPSEVWEACAMILMFRKTVAWAWTIPRSSCSNAFEDL